jgi:hypothetical protein
MEETKNYEIYDRLMQLIDILNLKRSQLSIKMGFSPTFFQKPRDFSVLVLKRLCELYPEVSLDWLLFGIGTPLIKRDKEKNEILGDSSMNQHTFADLLKIIEMQNKIMQSYICNNTYCEDMIHSLLHILEERYKSLINQSGQGLTVGFGDLMEIIKRQNREIMLLTKTKQFD